ncbi:hypothetical protein [Streptomyces chartreusis]
MPYRRKPRPGSRALWLPKGSNQAAALKSPTPMDWFAGITVEHALADHKRWKQLSRWTHRRDRLPDIYRAIASLASGRTAA